MKLRLSGRAKGDLLSIRSYTIEKFGAVQAAHYRGQLEQGFLSLRHFPQIGIVDRRLPRGHQAFKIAHHWICYEVDDNTIDVKAVIRNLDEFEE